MGALSRFMDAVFGESLPPAAADGDDGGWEERDYNKKLRRTLPSDQADVIKIADARARARYDEMDGHIHRLGTLRDRVRARRLKRKAKREAAEEQSGGE